MGYYRKKVLLGKTTIILLGFQGNIITAIFMKTTAHSRAFLSLFFQDHFFPYGILYSSSLYKTDHKLQAIWSWFRKKGKESKLGQPQLQTHTFCLQQLLRMHPRPRGRHEENHHLHLFSVSKLPISQWHHKASLLISKRHRKIHFFSSYSNIQNRKQDF